MSVATRILASSLSRQLRVSSLSRPASRLPRPVAPVACQRRTLFGFGQTNPEEPTPEVIEERAKAITNALMQKEEWRKLASHAGAMQSMQNLLVILSKKGIDVGSGKPPKLTDMMRLAADAEFRDAVTHMKAEMKNAGVDLDNPELVKSLMSMSATPKS